MGFELKVLCYILSDIAYYVIIALALHIFRDARKNLPKIVVWLLPISKLLMAALLWAVFACVGTPHDLPEKIATCIFALIGLLLPYLVNRSLSSQFGGSDVPDLVWSAIYAVTCFALVNIGSGDAPVIVALQITLLAAAMAGALGAVLGVLQKKKGR